MDISELMLRSDKEKQLRAKGFNTVEQLIWSFPRKYEDYTSPVTMHRWQENMTLNGAFILIGTKIEQSRYTGNPEKRSYVMMSAMADETGVPVKVFFFNQKLSYGTFRIFSPGKKFLVCGKAEYSVEYQSYTISSPVQFSEYAPEKLGLYPIYRAIPGMSDAYFRDVLAKAFLLSSVCAEPYPVSVAEQNGLTSLDAALRTIHAPENAERLRLAQERVVFDTLLKFSLQLQHAQSRMSKGSQYNLRNRDMARKIARALPYRLTKDQGDIINDAFRRMENGVRLQALVQGDVGSGKTVVAALLMAGMVGSGFQCALMAPSTVLARQHYEDLSRMFAPYGVNVALCVSGMKAKEKKALITGIAYGSVNIVVGTHAILNSDIHFKDLALVVTDEEHKFGVAQREALVEKASAGVHCVTMSATPIPRTLAQVLYGDCVELYTIKTMPKGRLPVITRRTWNPEKAMESAERRLREGNQVFVVCPAIEPNETIGKASVSVVSEKYREYFEPRGYKVATLTGRDMRTTAQKEAAAETIRSFAAGETNILIATTVIEVGVNIPNATMIIIHDADTFGTSTLHQLRGRVGRADKQSYCVLVTSPEKKNVKNPRLDLMVSTTDGFEIAKQDLEMRGAGDWLGSDQTGSTLPVQYMLAYPGVYEKAKQIAAQALRMGLNWPIIKEAFAEIEEPA